MLRAAVMSFHVQSRIHLLRHRRPGVAAELVVVSIIFIFCAYEYVASKWKCRRHRNLIYSSISHSVAGRHGCLARNVALHLQSGLFYKTTIDTNRPERFLLLRI